MGAADPTLNRQYHRASPSRVAPGEVSLLSRWISRRVPYYGQHAPRQLPRVAGDARAVVLLIPCPSATPLSLIASGHLCPTRRSFRQPGTSEPCGHCAPQERQCAKILERLPPWRSLCRSQSTSRRTLLSLPVSTRGYSAPICSNVHGVIKTKLDFGKKSYSAPARLSGVSGLLVAPIPDVAGVLRYT